LAASIYQETVRKALLNIGRITGKNDITVTAKQGKPSTL
jgi:hypothetical protein